MASGWFMITVLILPVAGHIFKTTCEIPSVDAGGTATLTTHFGEDLSKLPVVDFTVLHLKNSSRESKMLTCVFTNGDVECDKTPCCTWERHVTDVFRVYIHNVSQEHEGKFWGLLTPADGAYQKSCNFTLEAFTCHADLINSTNSHMICSNQPVVIGQTCTVVCSPGHYFAENRISVTYTCVGKNKWSPTIPVTSCEAYICPTDTIIATNSHMICSYHPVTIGETCTVTCSPGLYFQENQTSVTYTCVGKNKWSPEMPAIFCEEQPQGQKTQLLFPLFLLLSLIPIIIAIVILVKKRHEEKKMENKSEEEQLPIKSSDIQMVNLAPQESTISYWIHCIRTWYPELHSKTYFLPPFQFNRMLYKEDIAGGYKVLVQPTPQVSDVREDRPLERVLQCLHALADNSQQKDVMMVVSQLQFGKYLGKPSYAAAIDLSPRDRTHHSIHYDEDGYDVLIIHKTLGLLTLEIKNVERKLGQLEMTESQHQEVVEEVQKAIEQLKKAKTVLKYLTLGIAEIRITKIIVLPNISASQLQQAINGTPCEKDLCRCLHVKSLGDAVQLCLLSDHLPDQQISLGVNHSFLKAFSVWWQQQVNASGSQQSMTSEIYEQLVARFCGPATTVEVHYVTAPRLNIRTLGEAVSETGERVARLVLFPQQVDILNQSPPKVFLSGPPGTGKTIVLIMQGLAWIQRGHNVHVVSTCYESRAVTFVIEHQLQETVKTPTARSRVHRHQFVLWKAREVEIAVGRLESLSKWRQLCVIADEVMRDYRDPFGKFCDELINRIPSVYIWGASVHHDVRPTCLIEFNLTTPLRSPPVVVREVMQAVAIKNKQVHDYTVRDVPVVTDGPPVKRIDHHDGHSGHTRVMPYNCVKCGHEIGRILEELKVGQTVSGDSNGPPPLQYRDVLVQCIDYPTDDRRKLLCGKTTSASGLIRGLRECQVPVRVVEEGDEAAISEMALGVGDKVTVAYWKDVYGLERKVVFVQSGFERLYSMSRSTSQLVVIGH